MSTRPSNVDCTFSISWRRRPYFRKGRTVHNLGQTRSSHQHNHLLLAADTLSAPPYPACASASLSCMSVQPWVQDLRSTPLNSKPVGNWEALRLNDLCS